MANKLYTFNVVKIFRNSRTKEIEINRHQYQIPAPNMNHAWFVFGATHHRYEVFETEAFALYHVQHEQDGMGIWAELDSIT